MATDNINLIEVNDLNIPELAVYKDLNEAQLKHYYEPEAGIFICESAKVIKRALAAGYEPESLLTEFTEAEPDPDIQDIFIECKKVLCYHADTPVLQKLTGYNLTGGILCATRRKQLVDISVICKDMRRIAVLDAVTNPTNVGAIFRSAAAMGMDAVILTNGSTDPLYRRAARVSMGTVFQIPWSVYEGTEDYLTQLSAMGFHTVAMALTENAISIDDAGLKSHEKLAIILGNEGWGLPESTIDRCDDVAIIPMKQGVDSLNVAAASAVAFWEIGR